MIGKKELIKKSGERLRSAKIFREFNLFKKIKNQEKELANSLISIYSDNRHFYISDCEYFRSYVYFKANYSLQMTMKKYENFSINKTHEGFEQKFSWDYFEEHHNLLDSRNIINTLEKEVGKKEISKLVLYHLILNGGEFFGPLGGLDFAYHTQLDLKIPYQYLQEGNLVETLSYSGVNVKEFEKICLESNLESVQGYFNYGRPGCLLKKVPLVELIRNNYPRWDIN
ncbi:hypothetical protein KY334_05070 [Candidatus Woesearchaeota archaeon]|nr:hypothetical protein [Candidatus Woesearchaeota archaeon]